MSEPRTQSRRVMAAAPGLLHWTLHDDRIEFRSDAYAVLGVRGGSGHGAVLIDPLPLTDGALASFFGRGSTLPTKGTLVGPLEAICLTGSCHQRSAWRYRRLFGVKVHAPRGARGLEERPDATYTHGSRLPGGLVAVHAPGPTRVHYALHRPAGRGIVFCADVLTHHRGVVRFIDDAYQDAPSQTRATARALLKLRFGVLCFAHGAPLTRGAKQAVRAALGSDLEARDRS